MNEKTASRKRGEGEKVKETRPVSLKDIPAEKVPIKAENKEIDVAGLKNLIDEARKDEKRPKKEDKQK